MATGEVEEACRETGRSSSRTLRVLTIAVIVIGALVRVGVVRWSEPWDSHHPDEHILPLEALAQWEGITPREIGWPGSTTRLVHSAIAATHCVFEEWRPMWAQREHPDRALAVVSSWMSRRFVDPRPLYRMGRAISVVTGILQLIAVAWALGRWVGPIGTLIGTLAMALSPVAVAYSQYVLADITGLLFGTIALGLASDPTPRGVLAMTALIGLAASSKFHFGLWLLTPLLCIWLGDPAVFPRKGRLSIAVLLTMTWVMLTLVPWFLIDPLLALKEFAGVVLVKIGHGSVTLGHLSRNVLIIFGGFGALGWLGAIASPLGSRATEGRRFAPIVMPLVTATLVLIISATVFDRYGIVLMPGAVILAALGWDEWLGHERAAIRRLGAATLAIGVILTAMSLARSQRIVGEVDVDVLTRNWLVTNVSPGSRVYVHDEMNAFLPRTADQLRECATRVTTASAYEEKWLVEGVKTSAGETRPMEAMVLNDERFNAFWCRRELETGNPSGFHVVKYHDEPRFDAVLERDAVAAFKAGADRAHGGGEVLVMNRAIDAGTRPEQVFTTARGQRVIYRK